MNIFYVDQDPNVAAQMLVNRHVIKMIVESAQLMSTAHRLLDGQMYIDLTKNGRKIKRWRLPDDREAILNPASHVNHPSAVWCRDTNNNYNWLFLHFQGLLSEYTYRYGKRHAYDNPTLYQALRDPPKNIRIGHFYPPTPAMAEEYLVNKDSLLSYRNYYKNGKAHLHAWKKREAPEWIKDVA